MVGMTWVVSASSEDVRIVGTHNSGRPSLKAYIHFRAQIQLKPIPMGVPVHTMPTWLLELVED